MNRPVCPRDKIDLGDAFFEGEERSSRTQVRMRGADMGAIRLSRLLDCRQLLFLFPYNETDILVRENLHLHV